MGQDVGSLQELVYVLSYLSSFLSMAHREFASNDSDACWGETELDFTGLGERCSHLD